VGAGVGGTEAGGCEEVDPAELVPLLDGEFGVVLVPEVVGAVELNVGDEAKALDASPLLQPQAINADEIRQAYKTKYRDFPTLA